ncbi:hypothetical protein BRD06_02765 [Halobacteriales archaeon QS_9_67_15]|nr:MAG: hypothetical protein BRD06_02765 [Halobacteriales archaeon QS_9_67_15]
MALSPSFAQSGRVFILPAVRLSRISPPRGGEYLYEVTAGSISFRASSRLGPSNWVARKTNASPSSVSPSTSRTCSSSQLSTRISPASSISRKVRGVSRVAISHSSSPMSKDSLSSSARANTHRHCLRGWSDRSWSTRLSVSNSTPRAEHHSRRRCSSSRFGTLSSAPERRQMT